MYMIRDNILRLCAERNISPRTVCYALGLDEKTMKHWLNNEIPRLSKLDELADYFGVTVGDILEDPDYPYNRKDIDFSVFNL